MVRASGRRKPPGFVKFWIDEEDREAYTSRSSLRSYSTRNLRTMRLMLPWLVFDRHRQRAGFKILGRLLEPIFPDALRFGLEPVGEIGARLGSIDRKVRGDGEGRSGRARVVIVAADEDPRELFISTGLRFGRASTLGGCRRASSRSPVFRDGRGRSPNQSGSPDRSNGPASGGLHR